MSQLPILDQPNTLPKTFRVAMVGNPNVGKTSLFNRLTGLRSKTANYPGITVDVRLGRLLLPEETVELLDLPGLYSLDALSPEEKLAQSVLSGGTPEVPAADVILLVLDATNFQRNLFLASEVLELNQPTVVAVNLVDAAQAEGTVFNWKELESQLGCPVVPVSARTGAGLDQLKETLAEMLHSQLPTESQEPITCQVGCSGCVCTDRHQWANQVAKGSLEITGDPQQTTRRIDRFLTHSFLGIAAFLSVMLGVFYLIFSLADVPMTLIDEGFGSIASVVERLIPETAVHDALWMGSTGLITLFVFGLGYKLKKIRWGWQSGLIAACVAVVISLLPVEDFRSLLINGIIGGVGGVVVFLPQICILFFFISLLEDSGYMARAAFVMERLMRCVGLPGKAFVPMLSAHACAIPGIMAARVIENWRDRLVTILVLPLLTCSARLPVYAMVAALLFSGSPGNAALVFIGAYLLGIVAALLTAWVLKKSILQGDSEPLILELPPYRVPSLRNALLTVRDRASVFLRKAGTVILAISVVLWAMSTYPKLEEGELSPKVALLQSAADKAKGDPQKELQEQAEQQANQERLSYSFAGRTGRAVEPIFRPLGYDWKINVGVISSFAAREVIVSTLAIIYGTGEEESTLVETLRHQKREDGTLVFNTATCMSLLVFYVLAMQCLPTQVVTRRETGSWKWAIFQLVYMTALAYVCALIVYQTMTAFG